MADAEWSNRIPNGDYSVERNQFAARGSHVNVVESGEVAGKFRTDFEDHVILRGRAAALLVGPVGRPCMPVWFSPPSPML